MFSEKIKKKKRGYEENCVVIDFMTYEGLKVLL